MTYQIWKYPLQITDKQIIAMPKGAEILSVGLQHGFVTLWVKADIDGSNSLEPVTIGIFGTGKSLPEEVNVAQFIGTVQVLDGQLVWHVFRML